MSSVYTIFQTLNECQSPKVSLTFTGSLASKKRSQKTANLSKTLPVQPRVCRHLIITPIYVVYYPKLLEALDCIECLCMLQLYNFPSLEIRGPNLFQHDTPHLHKERGS